MNLLLNVFFTTSVPLAQLYRQVCFIFQIFKRAVFVWPPRIQCVIQSGRMCLITTYKLICQKMFYAQRFYLARKSEAKLFAYIRLTYPFPAEYFVYFSVI